MAMIFHVFAARCIDKLAELIENEAVMTSHVQEDIKQLKESLEYFSYVHEDAQAWAIGDEATKIWLMELKDVMYCVDNIIDLFMIRSETSVPCYSSASVCRDQALFSCFAGLQFNHNIAKKIKGINERLDRISKKRDMFNFERRNHPQFRITSVDTRQTSPVEEPGIVGRDIKRATDMMVDIIIKNRHRSISSVFGITGMGGIGKTTLAQKIYNEHKIREEFQILIWLCVSQSYSVTGLLKQAITKAGGNCDLLETVAELAPALLDSIRGKSVFLVLDDVWKSDVWINLLRLPFQSSVGAHGVLVTSRELDVLTEMHAVHIHRVNKMGESDGLELLMMKSFGQNEERAFSDIGEQIVQKCDGLPLAIKVIAGALSTKKSRMEWENIRDSNWSVKGLPKELGGSLYLSYKDLSPQLKQCFLWCSLLPEDYNIHRDIISCWWVAEGFITIEQNLSVYEVAEQYYLELIRRNLLQPTPSSIYQGRSTMHDLLRSLAQHLTKHESLFIKGDAVCIPNVHRLGISNVKDKLPAALKKQDCLRSLLLFHSQSFEATKNDTFIRLKHLRVLDLSHTSIRRIPESLKILMQLRLLDVSHSKIGSLPDFIGNLKKLEYLSVRGCRHLRSLPSSIMVLSNLGVLILSGCAITHVPQGIEKLQQLDDLRGIFEDGNGFRLDELHTLCKLRRLWIVRLEKARLGSQVLKDMSYLKELGICCTEGINPMHYQATDLGRIQQVYEMLIPSRNLRYLHTNGFPGERFPKWLSSQPQNTIPDLAQLHLHYCLSCLALPPAGQLPALLVLEIKGAYAIARMGAELLGQGVRSAACLTVFPKLNLLQVTEMHNLESWSLNTDNLFNEVSGNPLQIILMPRLQRLLLVDCPKLRALPDDLQKVSSLQRVHIEGVHSLEEITNLPGVVWLMVKNNRKLRRICNLYKLQRLFAQDCPALKQAVCLSSMELLYLVDCLQEECIRRCFLRQPDVLIHVATTGGDGRDVIPDESLYN